MAKSKKAEDSDVEIIFRRYIVKNGKRIYPKNGKCFPIRIKKGA